MLYDVQTHAQMISDSVRMAGYARALRQAVQPGSVVVDLGTGTGVFSLLACRYGARQVYAIEQDDVIQLARQLAAANECLERIQFIQERSARVSLPEPADVMVSDLRDILPWFGRHIPVIADARRRFLKPGGVLIPQRDSVWAAPVEAPNLHGLRPQAWGETAHGLDLGLVWRLAANDFRRARVWPEQLLAEPRCWALLEYARIENPGVEARIEWTIARAGTGHGFVAWFDSTLAEGAAFSNAPHAAEAIYGQAFFPWLEPVELHAGERVSVQLNGSLVGEEYIWSWESSVADPDRPEAPEASFKQSTFYGNVLSLAPLRKTAAGYVPFLDDDGRIDQQILGWMDGRNSLEEIARRLTEQFPQRFPEREEALSRAAGLSLRYSGQPPKGRDGERSKT